MSDPIPSLPQPSSRNANADRPSASSADRSDGASNEASRGASASRSAGPSEDRPAEARGDDTTARMDVSDLEIDTLDEETLNRLPAGQQEAVKNLHTQVARAVTAIETLKAENERLRRRVEELEQRPTVPDGETMITLPDDPESLRDTLTEFIDAIDAYLDGAPGNDTAAPTDTSSEAAGSASVASE